MAASSKALARLAELQQLGGSPDVRLGSLRALAFICSHSDEAAPAVQGEGQTVLVGRDSCEVDACVSGHAQRSQAVSAIVSEPLELWLAGFNASIFASGPSSLSDVKCSLLLGTPLLPGLCTHPNAPEPSIVECLVSGALRELRHESGPAAEFRLGISCLLLLGQELTDLLEGLLHGSAAEAGPSIFSSSSGSAGKLVGRVIQVRTWEEARGVLEAARGLSCKLSGGSGSAGGTTGKGAGAWRGAGVGHVVVQLSLERGQSALRGGGKCVSRLSLVDLAATRTATAISDSPSPSNKSWKQQEEQGKGARDLALTQQQLSKLPSLLAELSPPGSSSFSVAGPGRTKQQQQQRLAPQPEDLPPHLKACRLCSLLAPLLAGNVQPHLLLCLAATGPEAAEAAQLALGQACRARSIQNCLSRLSGAGVSLPSMVPFSVLVSRLAARTMAEGAGGKPRVAAAAAVGTAGSAGGRHRAAASSGEVAGVAGGMGGRVESRAFSAGAGTASSKCESRASDVSAAAAAAEPGGTRPASAPRARPRAFPSPASGPASFRSSADGAPSSAWSDPAHPGPSAKQPQHKQQPHPSSTLLSPPRPAKTPNPALKQKTRPSARLLLSPTRILPGSPGSYARAHSRSSQGVSNAGAGSYRSSGSSGGGAGGSYASHAPSSSTSVPPPESSCGYSFGAGSAARISYASSSGCEDPAHHHDNVSARVPSPQCPRSPGGRSYSQMHMLAASPSRSAPPTTGGAQQARGESDRDRAALTGAPMRDGAGSVEAGGGGSGALSRMEEKLASLRAVRKNGPLSSSQGLASSHSQSSNLASWSPERRSSSPSQGRPAWSAGPGAITASPWRPAVSSVSASVLGASAARAFGHDDDLLDAMLTPPHLRDTRHQASLREGGVTLGLHRGGAGTSLQGGGVASDVHQGSAETSLRKKTTAPSERPRSAPDTGGGGISARSSPSLAGLIPRAGQGSRDDEWMRLSPRSLSLLYEQQQQHREREEKSRPGALLRGPERSGGDGKQRDPERYEWDRLLSLQGASRPNNSTSGTTRGPPSGTIARLSSRPSGTTRGPVSGTAACGSVPRARSPRITLDPNQAGGGWSQKEKTSSPSLSPRPSSPSRWTLASADASRRKKRRGQKGAGQHINRGGKEGEGACSSSSSSSSDDGGDGYARRERRLRQGRQHWQQQEGGSGNEEEQEEEEEEEGGSGAFGGFAVPGQPTDDHHGTDQQGKRRAGAEQGSMHALWGTTRDSAAATAAVSTSAAAGEKGQLQSVNCALLGVVSRERAVQDGLKRRVQELEMQLRETEAHSEVRQAGAELAASELRRTMQHITAGGPLQEVMQVYECELSRLRKELCTAREGEARCASQLAETELLLAAMEREAAAARASMQEAPPSSLSPSSYSSAAGAAGASVFSAGGSRADERRATTVDRRTSCSSHASAASSAVSSREQAQAQAHAALLDACASSQLRQEQAVAILKRQLSAAERRAAKVESELAEEKKHGRALLLRARQAAMHTERLRALEQAAAEVEARGERCGMMVAEARGRSDRMEVELRRLRAENCVLQQQVSNLAAWRDRKGGDGGTNEEEEERNGVAVGAGLGGRLERLREARRGGKEAVAGEGVGAVGSSRHVSGGGVSSLPGNGQNTVAAEAVLSPLRFWSRKEADKEEESHRSRRGEVGDVGQRTPGGSKGGGEVGESASSDEEDDTSWVPRSDQQQEQQQEQRERAAVRALWADAKGQQHSHLHRISASASAGVTHAGAPRSPTTNKARALTHRGLLAVSPARKGAAGVSSAGLKGRAGDRSSRTAAVHTSLDRIIQELMG